MSRSTDEWIGASDDTAIPARVKIRVFDKFGGRCVHCTLEIRGRIRPIYDHRIALINGGGNCEGNLQLLCVPCHAVKTSGDVGEKSILARKRAKHIGAFAPKQKIASRGFPARRPQRTATRPIERRT